MADKKIYPESFADGRRKFDTLYAGPPFEEDPEILEDVYNGPDFEALYDGPGFGIFAEPEEKTPAQKVTDAVIDGIDEVRTTGQNSAGKTLNALKNSDK